MRRFSIFFIFFVIFCSKTLFAQDHGHNGKEHAQATEQVAQQQEQQGHHADDHGTSACGHAGEEAFDAGQLAFHHISDANVYSIGPWNIPLPCILYVPGEGWSTFSSSKFDIGHHGTGHKAYKRFVLDEGSVRHIEDKAFPMEPVTIDGIRHEEREVNGSRKNIAIVCYGGHEYLANARSTADGGMFGGGITSFYDFSITKNVVAMLVVFLLMAWMFLTVAKAYQKRDGKAPKGLQGLIEPIFLFIQDEVAKPFLGHKWEKYLPFLMSLFFFILGLNLFGQIPFLGNANVTGNLAFTMVLAVFTFLVTNFSGNKHYWQHVVWMPGVPAFVKVILTPVEILGLFIKPLTLMLRLFANITAGHMVLVIFVGLIFVMGESGKYPATSYGMAVGSAALSLFMMAIELLVAFLQAFVFTILTASYIGAAIEDEHH